MKTYATKQSDVQRDWYVVDASGIVVGRLATEIARILSGKNKPIYAPYLDCGDHVIVVNADRAVLSATKSAKKRYYRHSGYPGGLKETSFIEMMGKKPERIIELAVKGMLPKNRLGRKMYRKLKVYAGPEHPHTAQQPKLLELKSGVLQAVEG
jgi:large subunit ribosomal protein L13